MECTICMQNYGDKERLLPINGLLTNKITDWHMMVDAWSRSINEKICELESKMLDKYEENQMCRYQTLRETFEEERFYKKNRRRGVNWYIKP